MKKVAFIGSFNPVHEGHLWVVEMCNWLGFELLVVVADNPDKVYDTSGEDRADYLWEKCVTST